VLNTGNDNLLFTHFQGITNFDKEIPNTPPIYYSLAAMGDQDVTNPGWVDYERALE
jgi:hypothetical protein